MRPSRNFVVFLLVAACALSTLVTASQADAAAWLMEKGKGQLINNFFLYRTDKTFSASGNKVSSPEFTKLEYNPYVEYGWKEDTTLGMSLSLQSLNQEQPGGENNESGIGDIELFSRHLLYKEGQKVVSIQPLVKIPGIYDDKDALPLGQGQMDAEIRLLGGISFQFFDKWHYYNAEGAYRKRFGSPSDELRFDQTLGINIAKSWDVLLQSYHVFAVDARRGGPTLTVNSSDFDLAKAQLSVLKELDNGMKVQFGGFSHLDGENAGAGRGLLLSLWLHF